VVKRPSFQFYPADWRNNAKLRRCSEAARGAWMDVLCVLHDSDEYGVCRWPLSDLARAAGVPLKLLKELADKDVLKGIEKGLTQYVYTPRHAGKDGESVVLVESKDGPCWYCSRFVRDEYVRQRRGQSTQFSEGNQPPKATPKKAPKSTPKGVIGGRQGDGSTSTSTSTLKTSPLPPEGAKRDAAIALKTFLAECKAKGEKPIPDDDAVFDYAEKAGIPGDFLWLQWKEFVDRYCQPDAKRYKAWRVVFRKTVRGNWFKLWFVDSNGQYLLTTQGIQAQNLHKGKAA
jgi:hypothetical protein